MNNKKLGTIVVSVLIALVMFVGVWQPAFADFITKNGYAVGNQGIYLPGGLNPDNVWVTKVSKNAAGWAPVKWSRSPIMLHYTNQNGTANNTPFVMTYVYFNLYPWERRAYDKGNLGIYYVDVNTGNWKKCNSFLVDSGQTTDGRISCMVTQYNTVYGIGTPR